MSTTASGRKNEEKYTPGLDTVYELRMAYLCFGEESCTPGIGPGVHFSIAFIARHPEYQKTRRPAADGCVFV